MNDEPTGMNPDDEDIPPELKLQFEQIMKDVSDPLQNGLSVVSELYYGFMALGVPRIDAAVIVAAYVAVVDAIGSREQDES